MEGVAHQGSKEKLLGKNSDNKLVDYYSNEKHIGTTTPATFLVHATND